MQFERTVLIACPVGEVFDFLAEGPRCAAWRDGVREIARMTAATGVGAVFRQVMTGPGGHEIDGDYLITGYEPPRRLDFEVVAGPARPTGSFLLVPLDDTRTQVSFHMTTRLVGLRKLAAPYWNRRLRHEIAQLDRLKDILERAPSVA